MRHNSIKTRTLAFACLTISFGLCYQSQLVGIANQYQQESYDSDVQGDAEICGILKEYVNTPEDFKVELYDRKGNILLYGPVPGLVAAIKKFDQPIRVGALGVRKWRKDKPITIGDKLMLGSCTKALTAAMIGRLVDKKRLSLDYTIGETLPHLSGKIHEGYHDVTILQLLTHTGNIPREGAWHDHQDLDPSKQREAIVADALSKAPEKSDRSWQYSNLGYVLAAVIATKATGKSWERLMADEVFKPLQMNDSGLGVVDPQGRKLTQPWGHLILEDKISAINVGLPQAMWPCGSVHATISDWSKFALAMAGAELNRVGPPYLEKSTRERLFESTVPMQKTKSEYSCGWFVEKTSWASGKVYWHGGTNGKWVAHVYISPDDKIAYFCVFNGGTHHRSKSLGITIVDRLTKLK